MDHTVVGTGPKKSSQRLPSLSPGPPPELLDPSPFSLAGLPDIGRLDVRGAAPRLVVIVDVNPQVAVIPRWPRSVGKDGGEKRAKG